MRKSAHIGFLGLVAAGLIACGGSGSDTLAGGAGSSSGNNGAPAASTPGAADVDGGGSGSGSGSGGGGIGGGGTDDAGSGGGPGIAPPGDSGSTTPPPPPAGAGVPCDVAALLAAKCVGCHADPPVNGSLSGLVTLADLMATSKEDPSKNEAQLSLARMQSATSPMPPASVGNPATAAEIQAFQNWINGNYKGSCGDAGAPPAPTNVFTGAPAFTPQTAGSTHNAGKDCMGGCHNHGFTFAGTLTDGKGNPVAGAEVRLVDAKGVAISVHTGANGNFHSSTPFTAPAHVGARDATTTVTMVTALQSTNGGCNGCHATGATVAPIHLP